MTDATLISRNAEHRFLKKFQVKIDVSDVDDGHINNVLNDLRKSGWGFMIALANIIENK